MRPTQFNRQCLLFWILRHTYAATMMSEGRKAYLFSKRIGHKNINTTINTYGHLSNDVKKELANSTDKYI